MHKAGGISWFESAYDAMAFYQIHRDAFRNNPDLSRKSIFVSTGGTPTDMQIRGMLAATPNITQYLCFDNDNAGRSFVEKFMAIAKQMKIPSDKIKVFPMLPCYKDWNDVLLNKLNGEYLESIKIEVPPIGSIQDKEELTENEGIHSQSNFHR